MNKINIFKYIYQPVCQLKCKGGKVAFNAYLMHISQKSLFVFGRLKSELPSYSDETIILPPHVYIKRILFVFFVLRGHVYTYIQGALPPSPPYPPRVEKVGFLSIFIHFLNFLKRKIAYLHILINRLGNIKMLTETDILLRFWHCFGVFLIKKQHFLHVFFTVFQKISRTQRAVLYLYPKKPESPHAPLQELHNES